MAKATCLRAISYTITSEGGYVNDPVDPGGMTDHGLTARTLASWKHVPLASITKASMLALPMSEVVDLYRTHVWAALQCDLLPAGLDYAVFDEAVNSGNGRAVKALQMVLKVKPDGTMGLGTLRVLGTIKDIPGLIRAYDAERTTFLKKLKTWWRFGKGWAARVDLVTSRAILLNKAYPK